MVYGEGEWHQEKHDVAARRTWRKLHLAVDENHQLLAYELSIPEVGDSTVVPDLLAQIDTPFKIFLGDDAHDGELAVQRYKLIFGKAMKARALPQQKIETWISASALNRMTNLGLPVSVYKTLTINERMGTLVQILIYSTTPKNSRVLLSSAGKQIWMLDLVKHLKRWPHPDKPPY